MNRGQLIGYHRFTSRKNQKFCVAYVMVPFSQREIENDYVGSKVDELFLPDDMYDLLVPADIGKDVEIEYSISGGRAYVDDFRVVKK